ncbi:hypothetical protein Glove_221g83 [Diversispora epigaea]|uniref:Uncharacterized protein n=1 Tax=Diversispora epigaea TaxID=1348612 RepID=A0A397II89_9GLOM|nr:hypothetical protein Glove_221g83 [Diversispora epigaea]
MLVDSETSEINKKKLDEVSSKDPTVYDYNDGNQKTENNKRFYEEFDHLHNILKDNEVGIKTLDVTEIMPCLKLQVLKGLIILFTHVIPTHQKKESAVSHLVTGERGTEKSKEAKRKEICL